MSFFKKNKTRKNLTKMDIESIHKSLDYINSTAADVASMSAKYKRRYLLEGCEGDNDFMAICDSTTERLKDAYEILYQIVVSKQEELAKK